VSKRVSLDLSTESRRVRKYLRERCSDYMKYENLGPGDPYDPITQITAGYEVEQCGWCAIVFDTRPNPKIDGEWTKWIDETAIYIPKWACPETAEISIRNKDGLVVPIPHVNQFAVQLGVMLLEDVKQHFTMRTRKKLEIAEQCLFTIEEFDGHFEWDDEL